MQHLLRNAIAKEGLLDSKDVEVQQQSWQVSFFSKALLDALDTLDASSLYLKMYTKILTYLQQIPLLNPYLAQKHQLSLKSDLDLELHSLPCYLRLVDLRGHLGSWHRQTTLRFLQSELRITLMMASLQSQELLDLWDL